MSAEKFNKKEERRGEERTGEGRGGEGRGEGRGDERKRRGEQRRGEKRRKQEDLPYTDPLLTLANYILRLLALLTHFSRFVPGPLSGACITEDHQKLH